ncbi:MAG: hypothetical protein AAF502_20900 [Bacteroidota bacterium]
MSDLWSYFKNLFKSAEKSSPTNPFIHELIERNDAEIADYNKWKEGLDKRRIIDWVNNEYVVFMTQPDDVDTDLDFLNTPMSKGFVLHFRKERHAERDFIHLFDYLKEKVLSLGYRSYMSDTRTYNRGQKVETVQRHYLKPAFSKKGDQKLDQRFGNITVELLQVNNIVINLKFSATGYVDHNFSAVEDYKKLMASVMN